MKNPSPARAALLLVLLLAACGGSPTRESMGEYFDDSVITSKIKAAFVEDNEIKAGAIGVETFKGVVQLSGFVDKRAEVAQAARIAGQVPGVKAVRNDIRVKAEVESGSESGGD